MSFSSTGLRDIFLSALDSQGHAEPTPIQQAAIPAVISGKDVMGIAQTGSGKTASFVLPILQKLITERQSFSPGDDEEVLDVRRRIKLANHEAVIVRNKEGEDSYRFGRGNQEERSFFLPPYSELVKLIWSRGRRRGRKDLVIEKIDLR